MGGLRPQNMMPLSEAVLWRDICPEYPEPWLRLESAEPPDEPSVVDASRSSEPAPIVLREVAVLRSRAADSRHSFTPP